MEKRAKSQWDFGELFPPPVQAPARRILSVSELTAQVRRLLEQQVGSVWVTGELTNLRVQNSGHIYFTLKDAGAQLSCVLFRGEAVAHRELLKDGQKLLLRGDVTVYEARGQYQLIVRAIELQGTGALQIAFEKLKQKLQAEGLFAAARKRALPKYPERIGLVTSPTGAAIRDVLHVVRRRNPGLEILLAPCRVQGEGAAGEIAEAIQNLNAWAFAHAAGVPAGKRAGEKSSAEAHRLITSSARPPLDLILVTRGGGSLEDLWAFNEEIVARAIFESRLPVVSAVGHEIDYTISDFVADVRAATPSAGAEIITEGVFSSCQFMAQARVRLRQLATRQWAGKKERLEGLRQRRARAHPRRRLNESAQRLDDLLGAMARCARQASRRQQVRWQHLAERLGRVRPALMLGRRRELVGLELRKLRDRVRQVLREGRNRFSLLDSRLNLLGPQQVLARGYSITTDAATGKVLRQATEVVRGQRLKTRLKSGHVISRAEDSLGG